MILRPAPVLLALTCATALGCAARAGAAELKACVTTPDGAPLADAALVLEGSGIPGPARTQASIQQIDREFVPYLTIVRQGTEIEFPNRDPLKHHVYSFSPAKLFEIKLYAGKPASPVLFDKTGTVAIGCNIHDWMEAYILVVDTPYFAKTDQTGCARIEDVPPAPYRLRLWHPRQKRAVLDRPVNLADGFPVQALTLDVAPPIPRAKPPVDKEGY